MLSGLFRRLAFLVVMAVSLFGVGKAANAIMGTAPASRPPIVKVPNGTAAVDAAHDKARATLGQFWVAFDAKTPGTSDFFLKVRFPLSGMGQAVGEHMWVKSITRLSPDRFAAVLDNEPKYAKQLKRGQRVEFTQDMISDWSFMRNGKMVGNESMRPLLARMPQAEAARYRSMLETP